MGYLTCTIVGDGSSDRALVPVIEWLLKQKTERSFSLNFICSQDVRTSILRLKIERALALFPCDVLFVHRDAERVDHVQSRLREIEEAVPEGAFEVVPIVPVRMTEAWLLIDIAALRRAADNPNGAMKLAVPDLRRVESLLDPKQVLFALLRDASGLNPRRLRSFNEARARLRLAELISDFSPLRCLSAFQGLEVRLEGALSRIG